MWLDLILIFFVVAPLIGWSEFGAWRSGVIAAAADDGSPILSPPAVQATQEAPLHRGLEL
jgi:hypothetical protein